jgi:hypothetical protein
MATRERLKETNVIAEVQEYRQNYKNHSGRMEETAFHSWLFVTDQGDSET